MKTFQCIPGAVAGYYGDKEVLQLPELEVGVREGSSVLVPCDGPGMTVLGVLLTPKLPVAGIFQSLSLSLPFRKM